MSDFILISLQRAKNVRRHFLNPSELMLHVDLNVNFIEKLDVKYSSVFNKFHT